jgi:predicted RNase H-like nuclease
MLYVGADGCHAGWFWVALDEQDNYQIGIDARIVDVVTRFKSARLVLIDIPIGLRDSCKKERLCDLEARRVLGPSRASSVFPVPCRAAVGSNCYTEAVNINRELCGRGVSKQTWNIVPKIKEVDKLMRQIEPRNVKEIHPEVCFWALNASAAMKHNKKTDSGFDERIETLNCFLAVGRSIVNDGLTEFARKDVVRDDIVDALAAAVTARCESHLRTLPRRPEVDACGLPMQMVYAEVPV